MLKILLSPQDVQTVLKALGAMPLGESLQAFMRIQQQLAEQQAAAGTPAQVPGAPVTPPGNLNGADKQAGE